MNTRNALIAAALFGASLASASLLVEENFNYTVDSNIGGVAATGTGLTGNWQRTFTDTATATLIYPKLSPCQTANTGKMNSERTRMKGTLALQIYTFGRGVLFLTMSHAAIHIS
ncbi:hypothetical protein [Limnospira sp. PMC 1243.20]|uniref:hypothetical protein n=1 Tax=Limnospira sp. PMC 1243.20 TaxID=2981041 RepID=UPI0028E1347D|nr:hypothetical protein [Limnospira sp. PMC 1243.20]MDT9206360.1 hypothetical protein [Limnospira sp. PMC 1243.20]